MFALYRRRYILHILDLCFLNQAAYAPAKAACTLGSVLRTPRIANDTLYINSASVFWTQ